MKTIKATEGEDEEIEVSTKQAARIVVKSVEKDLDPKTKGNVQDAVEDYLSKDEDEVIKITSGDSNKNDIRKIATASILSKVSGNSDRATSISQNIPASRQQAALKAVNKGFANEIIPSQKSIDLSIDPRVTAYSPEKIVGNKSPEHVYEKRRLDFETNLKKDLINAFKVLENHPIPIKFEKMELVEKPQRRGELMKSDINIAKIQLRDKFGNVHNIEMELPKIDPNTGTFRLYGQKKALINQLVQCPITFPKPGQSRFESSYSRFRIYIKELRNKKYLESYMIYKMPYIFLIAYSFGFDTMMNMYKIKYEIVDKKPTGDYVNKLGDGRFLVFTNVDSDLKKYICASFAQGKADQFKTTSLFPSPEYFEKWIINHTGRLNSTFHIMQQVNNIVDPVTAQVLRNMQLPSVLPMIMKYMSEKVTVGYTIDRNDLANLRIRNSEILIHLAQKQISAAYTTYREQVISGNEEAKLTINSTKVLSEFRDTELVVNMEYANPVEEMATMTRTSPVGKEVSGIPDKRAIAESARNLHDSYFGNIDPLDTPEGGNIGLVQQLTIDALISSSRGLFGVKTLNDNEGAGMLSTTTCMIPFLENTDGARVIMLANQAKQCLPLKNPQAPVVQSGYESILTGVLSDSFVKKAPCAGKITKITKDAIYMKCTTGQNKIVDIIPMHLKSMSGKNTLSVFKPTIKVGDVVKNNYVIAEGACMSNGSISLGRPLLTAFMPYKGYNFEDGAVVGQSVLDSEKLVSLHGIEIEVLVSENDRILQLAGIGQKVNKGETLIRKTIGEVEQLIGFDDDESEQIYSGQYIKKSPGGTIVDIEVYSNIPSSKFPKIKDLIDRTDKKFGRAGREKFTVKGETIKGILFKFKIEQELQIEVGDKLCNRYGNKGIISLIEKDELMPRMPNGDRIEIIVNPLGILGRMNFGQIYEMYCGLISRELGRIIPTLNTRTKIVQLLQKVYSNLDMSPNKKITTMLVSNLNRLSMEKFKVLINEVKKTGFYPIIIPPFKAPGANDIKKALDVLNLKTSYTLTLPEYNVKTKSPVSVGYMYMCKLEHLGGEKIYGRSTGPVTSKTSQPTSGKQHEGGQRLGELDTYSFISYNVPHVLAEFMGPLSDDYITKEEILADIVKNGEAGYKEPKISPARDLLNSYFVSLMLER
jgi:DNA-directed RNA polymerase beta subunit